MEERFLEQMLKENVRKLVSEKIEQEIAKQVCEFKKQLEDNKDYYIAEVMKGIKFYHQREPYTNQMTYKIIFENITRIEK